MSRKYYISRETYLEIYGDEDFPIFVEDANRINEKMKEFGFEKHDTDFGLVFKKGNDQELSYQYEIGPYGLTIFLCCILKNGVAEWVIDYLRLGRW